MKENTKISAALFVVATVIGAAFQSYNFIHQENLGIFLLTPDWLQAALSESRPVSYIITSFLVQFYDIVLVGPVISALLVTLLFAMWRSALGRVLRSHVAIVASTVIACAVWSLSAVFSTQQFLVSAALYTFPIWLVSRFVHLSLRDGKPALLVSTVVILVAACYIAFSPKAQYNERKSKIEICARKGNWKAVEKAASPKACEKHREFLPYGLLALNMQGRLANEMRAYPVKSREDLDMEGVLNREGYYFSSILNECLGCYNEAIHLMFQSSTYLNHGLGSVTLYQLIRYNIENEDYEMVSKYAKVLSRSPRNHFLAKKILKTYSGRESRSEQGSSSTNPLITNNPIHNLGTLYTAGMGTTIGNERLSAYMSLAQPE